MSRLINYREALYMDQIKPQTLADILSIFKTRLETHCQTFDHEAKIMKKRYYKRSVILESIRIKPDLFRVGC